MIQPLLLTLFLVISPLVKDEKLLGESVTIRGFLYQSTDGEWILADQPNLKTCCVGKKVGQIFLDGDFSEIPTYKPVSITGTLTLKNDLYHLENTELVK